MARAKINRNERVMVIIRMPFSGELMIFTCKQMFFIKVNSTIFGYLINGKNMFFAKYINKLLINTKIKYIIFNIV